MGKLASVFWWVELDLFFLECNVVTFEVSMGLAWLWAACLLMFSIVFLFCLRIIVLCLVLDLVGSCVETAFSVSVETFG